MYRKGLRAKPLAPPVKIAPSFRSSESECWELCRRWKPVPSELAKVRHSADRNWVPIRREPLFPWREQEHSCSSPSEEPGGNNSSWQMRERSTGGRAPAFPRESRLPRALPPRVQLDGARAQALAWRREPRAKPASGSHPMLPCNLRVFVLHPARRDGRRPERNPC